MFTVQAKAVEKIAKAAAAQGVPAEQLYDSVKLDPAVLLDPDNRIPFAQLVALYENAAEFTGDALCTKSRNRAPKARNIKARGKCRATRGTSPLVAISKIR